MNLYKKKYLYANGSSVTAGGGFERMEHRQNVRQLYEKKYPNTKLPEAQVECSYPHFVAKKLNLELINDAKSGSGIDRLIRTTFIWIMANKDKVDQTIFLLEPQVGVRLDYYVFEWQDYGVLNAHKKGDEYDFMLVKDWYVDDKDEQINWNEKYKTIINQHLLNFFDADEQYQAELRRLAIFLEFLNSRNIDYLVSLPEAHHEFFQDGGKPGNPRLRHFRKIIPKKCDLNYAFNEQEPNKVNNNVGIWTYAEDKKLLIRNEIDNNDNHIGYFGNQIVADKIINYIKHNNTIKYFCPVQIPNFEKDFNLTNYLPIEFQRVDNPDQADFIYLEEFHIFAYRQVIMDGKDKLQENTKKFTESINRECGWLKEIVTENKRFLLVLKHERVHSKVFVEFLKFIKNEFNINPSQIWYIDTNATDYPSTNFVPLEVKFRIFQELNKVNVKCFKDDYRNKKITMLNNKVSIHRLRVFDNLLNEYKDHNLLKNENIISMIEDAWLQEQPQLPLIPPPDFNFDISKYREIGLPWHTDTSEKYHIKRDYTEIAQLLTSVLDHHKQSIFSIVNETEHGDYVDVTNFENFQNQQFSEKSLLAILSETFVFITWDGLFYRNLERIGFDFSYLKKLFNIDYLTNTNKDNAIAASIIARFATINSIETLNNFRKEHYHYIEHNKKLLMSIIFGDPNETELKFWEQLSGKILR